MKLRRNSQPKTRQRRQVVDPDTRPVSTSFSYRTSRSEQVDNTGRDPSRENTPKPEKNLGRFLLQRFGLIILLLALIVSALNMVSLSKNAKIVSVTGNKNTIFLHTESEYSQAANKLLASSVWNGNKITVNSENVSEQMLRQFPELTSASLTLPLFSKRPVLYVQASQPILILNTEQGSFVVDNAGKALLLKENLANADKLGLPQVNDLSNLKVTLNKQVLTSDNVSFIRTVIEQLKAKSYNVSTMSLPSAANELDVNLEGQPYDIKFNLRSNTARQQAGTFLATIAKLRGQNVVPSKYVDVRVDGRAYYQ